MVALCGRRRPTLPRFRRSTIGARGFNLDAVPSARAVLTSLFGMGRGGTRCFRHHVPSMSRPPGPSTSTGNREHPLQENLGLLVPLGFAVAGFTPAAYPRRRLRRPSMEASSSGEFRT